MADLTYDNGWQVQDWYEAQAPYAEWQRMQQLASDPAYAGQTFAYGPDGGTFTVGRDTLPTEQEIIAQILGASQDQYHGLTGGEVLQQIGVQNPTDMSAALPDALPGSLIPAGNDLAGMMVFAAPLAGMLGGWAAGAGAMGAEGAAAGAAAGLDPALAAGAMGGEVTGGLTLADTLGGTWGLGAGGSTIPELGLIADPTTAAQAISQGIPPEMLAGGPDALTLGQVSGNLPEPGFEQGELPGNTPDAGFEQGEFPGNEPDPGFEQGTLPSSNTPTPQQLADAITGGLGNAATTMFGIPPTGGSQGYVRRARKGLMQPAFLGGGQGQQPLGSEEEAAFNEAWQQHGEDVSTRARQMAAQIRGRPGFFGVR